VEHFKGLFDIFQVFLTFILFIRADFLGLFVFELVEVKSLEMRCFLNFITLLDSVYLGFIFNRFLLEGFVLFRKIELKIFVGNFDGFLFALAFRR
jgi:hypothetical protein